MLTIMLKDWRENLVTYLGFIAGTTALVFLIIKCFQRDIGGTYFLIFSVIVFSCFTALVSANLVAGEKSRRTLPFLLSLPGSRAVLWLAKFAAGLVVVAAVGFLLFRFIDLIEPKEEISSLSLTDLSIYSSGILALYCLGYAASIVFERVLTAMVVSLLTWAGLMYLILTLYASFYLNPILLNLVLALCFTSCSLFIFIRGDLLDRSRLWKTALLGLVVSLAVCAACLGGALLAAIPGSDPGDVYNVALSGGSDQARPNVVGMRVTTKFSLLSLVMPGHFSGEDIRLCLIDTDGGGAELVPERYIRFFDIAPGGRWVVFTSIGNRLNMPVTRTDTMESITGVLEPREIRFPADHYRCCLYDRKTSSIIPLQLDGRTVIGTDVKEIRCFWNPDDTSFALVLNYNDSPEGRYAVNLFTTGESRPGSVFSVTGQHCSSYRYPFSHLYEDYRPAGTWSADGRVFYMAIYESHSGRAWTVVSFDAESGRPGFPLESLEGTSGYFKELRMIGNKAVLLGDSTVDESGSAGAWWYDFDTGESGRGTLPDAVAADFGNTEGGAMRFTGPAEITYLRHIEGEIKTGEPDTVLLIRANLQAGTRTVLAQVDNLSWYVLEPGDDVSYIIHRDEPPVIESYRVDYAAGTIEKQATAESFPLWINFFPPTMAGRAYCFDPLPAFRLAAIDLETLRQDSVYTFPPSARSPELIRRIKLFRRRHAK